VNDEELLAHLKAMDPTLTSYAPPTGIDQLVETAIMIDERARQTEKTADVVVLPAQTTTVGRRRRVLGVTAAVAALLAGSGVAWQFAADGGAVTPGHPLSLSVQDARHGAKCAQPTASRLRGYPLAFEGTVTERKAHQVTFSVDHWYRGGKSPEVLLGSDDDLPEALAFEVGQSYLVAARNDAVPVCGGVNLATEETRNQFHRAFEE
jgi:hypothetical protein